MPVRSLSLLIVLLVSRLMASIGHQVTIDWWAPVAYLWHDAAVVLAFAAAELLLRSRPRIVTLFYVLAAVYVVANIPVQRALWSPLTLPMWRAAGGPLADSIRYYATWTNLLLTAVAAAAIVAAPSIARRLPARAVFALLTACTALGPTALRHTDLQGAERNAWTALVESVAFEPAARLEARDWRASDFSVPPDKRLRELRGAMARRNVVLVSLESTASRYLGIYGAQPDVAPNLTALATSGVTFEHAYAVYPESIKGLFSVLCSVSPAFDTHAASYAKIPCTPIAERLLEERDYRTALFHSGRFDYLGMNAVVRNRGFEVLEDAGDIGGRRDSSFGIDEASTVTRILRWIDQGDARRPFFVTYLPIAGHHPYEAAERGPFPDDDEFGRYRNALHYGDAALGELRRGLQARGLDDDTVWIVFGDHGEAFGQHQGNYGHTFQLYDENVRVPFVIAAPGVVSRPVRAHHVVSLLDTAPTLLDLLGLPIAPQYEGRSMLDGRSRAALFFTDYSLPLAGLRDGPNKVIYDMRSGRTQWFDVERDAAESVDLSLRYPDQARRYARRLDGWAAARRQALSPYVR